MKYLILLPLLMLAGCSSYDQESLQMICQALLVIGTFSGVIPAILICLIIGLVKVLIQATVTTVKDVTVTDTRKPGAPSGGYKFELTRKRLWDALEGEDDDEKA